MSLVLALLAMAAAAQAAEPSPGPYRAEGSDPDWILTIDGTRVRLERPGEEAIIAEVKPPQIEDGIAHYESATLGIDIMPSPCTGATGKRYSDSVYLSLDGEELGGCGGEELPIDSLNGTSWYFAEIAGEDTGLTGDLFKDDRYAIDFGPDAFSGYTGCNRFSGSYTQHDGIFTLKPGGMTRRRCGEPIARREVKLFEILSGPVRMSFPHPGTMVLTGDAGTVKLTRSTRDQ
jgi:heat shock protein HslJ/uncharacterized membrane protein